MKIYIGGPDIFAPDAQERLQTKIKLVQEIGHEPITPYEADNATTKFDAHRIAEENRKLMNKADAMIANLTPYHGPSADVGTAYEVGYMQGQNKPVFAYSNNHDAFSTRVKTYLAQNEEHKDWQIEDFEGMKDNLMLGDIDDSFFATLQKIVKLEKK